MDFKRSSTLVKTYITKTRLGKKSKPGMSYILNKMLTLPALATMLTSNYSTQEILSLAYMVYFLFEGDDMISAEWKSKNDIYIVDVTEVGDVNTPDTDCDICYGDGTIECPECNGESEIDCSQCGGDSFNGEECNSCDTGTETCPECEGTSEVTCQECDGDGTWEQEEQVFFNRESWIISNEITIQSIKDMSKRDTFNDNLYDILDDNKGNFYLAGTVNEFKSEPLDEFERIYGDYNELQGHTMINQIINLRDLDKLPDVSIRVDDKTIKVNF